MELVGWAAQKLDEEKVTACFIDVIGLGNGVYFRLKELGYRVYPVDVRIASIDERFKNVRAELSWKAREAFENNLPSIPDDRIFKSELWTPKFKRLSSKSIQVEDKYEIKKRLALSNSPNHADSFNLTLKFNDSMFRKVSQKDPYAVPERQPDFGGRAWMAA
jgi:hypothetical protein